MTGVAEGGPIRVLLADDTSEIRTLLRVALELDDRFLVVGEAGDGLEAVRAVEAEQPDAIVLDLAMPVMDGLQAIAEIRRASPETKILVLSGFDAAQMEGEALREGASTYLEKGVAFDELADTLAGLFERGAAPPAVRVEAAADGLEETAQTTTDELLSIAIHELRSPVAVVLGFAATLARAVERLDVDTIRAGGEAIERNARHLAALLGSFADVRALETGRLSLRLARTDVGELVRQTVSDLAEVTQPHPVTLSVEGRPSRPSTPCGSARS